MGRHVEPAGPDRVHGQSGEILGRESALDERVDQVADRLAGRSVGQGPEAFGPVALRAGDPGAEEAGAQHVGRHLRTLHRELVGQRLGDAEDRVLARGVRREVRDGHEPGERGRVDDRTLVLLHQPRAEGADAVDDAHEVHAEHPLPVGERALPDRVTQPAHTRVVAHDVGRAELLERAGRQPVDRGGVRDVRDHPDGLGTAARNSPTALSRATSSTSASTRRIPAPANADARANPIPPAPPVTTATFPESSSMDGRLRRTVAARDQSPDPVP